MPEYYGDRAGVLPDNTAALIHFSDQFAQMAQQRRAQKAAQARAQQESDIAFAKYMNGVTANKEFATKTQAQPFIDNGLEELQRNAAQMKKSGVPDSDMYSYVGQQTNDLLAKSRKITQVNDELVKYLANWRLQHPDADPNKFADATSKNLWFNPDGKLNDPSELNPSKVASIVDDTYRKNPELFYSAEAQNKSLDALFGKANSTKKIEELSVNDPNNGNLLVPGILPINAPPFVTVQKDDKGKTIYDQNHKAKVTIEGVEPFKLPNSDKPYINPEGQQVKVLSQEAYERLPPATKAGITGKLKDILSKQVDEKGEPIHDIDSPFADMVKRNLAFSVLQGEAEKRYELSPQKDETFDRKRKIFADNLAAIRNQIAQRNANRSDQEFSYRKKKDKETDGNGKPIEPRFDKVMGNAMEVTVGGNKLKIVDVTDMDIDEYKELAGSEAKTITDAKGNSVTTYDKGIEPFKAGGRKILYVNEKTGNLEGENGAITREASIVRQIKDVPKTKFSILQKTKDAIKNVISPSKQKTIIPKGNVR